MEKLLDDEFVHDEMKYWNIPGFSISVSHNGKTIFEKGYGYRDISNKKPMTVDTLGGIASCSKSFTSAVLASLVDEGLLDFDKPIIEYIPDFALMDENATKEVTVRDMLYHRTGLAGHDAMWPNKAIDRDEYMYRLRYLEPNEPFRSKTQYSNTIYNLLGHIAERISGDSWEKLVEERIFKPLGMSRSCLTVEEMRSNEDFAIGYFERERNKELEEMRPWEMNVGAPAAGVNSCVSDMIKWINMHINNGVYDGKRIFSEDVMKQMHHGAVDMDIFPWKADEILDYGYYGMAWKTVFYRGMPLVFHSGEIEGYCTMEAFIQDKGIGFMLLVNKHKPCAPFLNTIAYTIIDNILGLPKVDWSGRLHKFDGVFGGSHYDWKVDLLKGKPITNTTLSHRIEEYAGDYESKAYGKYSVELEQNNLFLLFKEWKLPMEHYHFDTFKITDLKEDTIYITMPMTYHYDEFSGDIDGFFLKLEPEVDSIWFKKIK